MASGLTRLDRRSHRRIPAEDSVWQALAVLRPGREVVVINVSAGGVLVESPVRMNPGGRAELQLFGAVRQQVRGRVSRCRVARLMPLRYEGAIVFDEQLDLEGASDARG